VLLHGQGRHPNRIHSGELEQRAGLDRFGFLHEGIAEADVDPDGFELATRELRNRAIPSRANANVRGRSHSPGAEHKEVVQIQT
jgi:hypothetical protein